MTASPRSGPALLIAACILTVTGTVCAGNSNVQSSPSQRTPQAKGQLARHHHNRPAGAVSPRATPRPAATASTTTRTTPPRARQRPRGRDATLRQGRQWLLRLVAPLRRPGARPTATLSARR